MSAGKNRKLTPKEQKYHSLSARTFRMTLLQTLSISFVALIIGLGLYTNSMLHESVSEAFSVVRTAGALLEQSVDIQPFSDAVMDIYYAQTEEERNQVWTDEYRERFTALKEREDYRAIDQILLKFVDGFDLSAIYLAAFDEKNSAMVYVMDSGPPELVLTPGDWESVSPEGIQSFLNWDGTDPIYEIANTKEYGWLCSSGIPVHGSEGEVKAFLFVDVMLKDVWNGMRQIVISFIVALGLATTVFAIVIPRRIQKSIAEPITTIAKAAENYVKDRQAGKEVYDHFSRLNIQTRDEVENLAEVMANMEQDMSAYMDNLARVTAEKERISTELSLAKQIQESMLPHIFPPFPERSEFDVYAIMDPAKEVGGDFYDYFLIDEDHLGIVIADVSGKGVPAALFMMATKIILQNNAMLGLPPGETLTRSNEAICSQNDQEMFVTVWLGILEISTGRLSAANAGHEYPTMMKAGGLFELVKDKHGFVIGGMDGVQYTDYELQLSPGDKIFVYTDGLVEATNTDKTLYGSERMLAALNQCREKELKDILGHIRADVDLFVGDEPQFDDLTMLCLEYKGPEPL